MSFHAIRQFACDRLVWVAVVFLVLALRDTSLLTAPRFWGEEGLYYYAPAWAGSPAEAVFGCPQDYYNLGCRLGSLFALLLPVEHAPLGTTVFALLVQAIPPLLVLRVARRCSWGRTATAAATAAMLIAPPIHETWLTSTGSAHYFVLAGALVVLYHDRLGLRWTGWLVALAAGLSSGYAFGLVPVAVWLAVRHRGTGRAALVAWLLAGLAVQVVAYASSDLAFSRGSVATPAIALAVMVTKCCVLPVAGLAAADHVGAHVLWQWHLGDFWWWSPLLALPIVLLWASIVRSGSRSAVLALACGHVLAATALVGSLGDKVGMVGGDALGRYFVPVNALHMLAAIEALRAGRRGWMRVVPLVLAVGGLVQGARQYFDRPAFYSAGPDWRSEVAAWRQDPTRGLATWPDAPGWVLHLPPP
jgi:hypothetical protein